MRRIGGTRVIELDGQAVCVTAFNTEENTRTCRVCKESKPFTDFGTKLQGSNGQRYLRTECRVCNSYLARNWNVLHPEKRPPGEYRSFRHKWISRYGITPEDYDRMLEEQGGVCKICSQTPGEGKTLHIDHDHGCCSGQFSCGKCVRGLLCSYCNTGIGMLKDSPDILRAALAYLGHQG